MQRIPTMDVFATPKQMGVPVYMGQATDVSTPRGSSITTFRFEIMDSEGNPIPGAAVSIYFNDILLVTPALSDVGGNVAVSTKDMWAAELKLRDLVKKYGDQAPLGPRGQKKIYAVVEAPGYQEQKIELADMDIITDARDIKKIYPVTLEKAENSSLLPIIGVTAGVGLLIWFANRS